MKLYLAHPTKERYMVRAMLQPELVSRGHIILNPFECLGREDVFFAATPLDLNDLAAQEQKAESPQSVVYKEQQMIKSADALFAYFSPEDVSLGTSMEIMYNSLVLGRGKEKTFVFIDTTEPDNYFLIHPWLLTYATVSNDLEYLFKKVGELNG